MQRITYFSAFIALQVHTCSYSVKSNTIAYHACIININIKEYHIVISFSALLYQSFCTVLLLHNNLISSILVYLCLLHIDTYTCIKPAQHNYHTIIHLSHFTMSVCYPYKKRDYFWPNKYSFLHKKFT